MHVGQAVAGFAVVAALITLVPGLDTALVVRSALTQGRRSAMLTAVGVASGVLVWGAAAAVGVAALLAVSEIAYEVVRLAGAAYLLFLGVRLVVAAVRGGSQLDLQDATTQPIGSARAWATGAATNLLNPKIGVFYLATLPQFLVPQVAPLAMGLLLAGVHVLIGLVWLGLLIVAANAASRWLRRPSVARSIDGITGVVLIVFGIRTALERG